MHALAGKPISTAASSGVKSVGGPHWLVAPSSLAAPRRAALHALKSLNPEITLKWVEEWLPFAREEDRRKYVEGLRMAGLE
jgi:hypothetical protein